MDYLKEIDQYRESLNATQVAEVVACGAEKALKNHCVDVYRRCYGAIDLTSLNATDTSQSITALVEKVVLFGNHFKGTPNVASVCVYPLFVDAAGLSAGSSGVNITTVAGGFPSSQTYLEVKMLEIAMAVENGADEVDIVMNPGQLLDGEYDALGGEIELLRGEVGQDVLLKIIIETGELKSHEMIRRGSLLAMVAGADFIKTSTGKTAVSATPEAAVLMCTAIKDYFEHTGRRVGFKVAGGVKTTEDAVLYYTIVEIILGQEWLSPSLFRIGTSSAANALLSSIEGRQIEYF